MTRILTGGTVLALALSWSAWGTAQTRDETQPRDRQDQQQQQDRQRGDQDQQAREHHARGRITAIGAAAQVSQSDQSAEARRGTFITVEGRAGDRRGGEGRPEADRGDQARREDRPAADRDAQARREDRPQDRPGAAPGARADADNDAQRDRGARTTFLFLVTDATRIEHVAGAQQPAQAAANANPQPGAARREGDAQNRLRGLEVGQRVEVTFRPLEREGRRGAGQPGQGRDDRNQADQGQQDRNRDQANPGQQDRDRNQADQGERDRDQASQRTVRGEAIAIRVLPARGGEGRGDDDQDRPGPRNPAPIP